MGTAAPPQALIDPQVAMFLGVLLFVCGAVYGSGHPAGAVVSSLATGAIGMLLLESTLDGFVWSRWWLALPAGAVLGVPVGAALASWWEGRQRARGGWT
jgi:uncharacterized lipoprotein YbaY